tara:strand:+ start:92 stop:556 length:465 start_codon:yes stop_codon:yes gene_type:complete
MEKNKEYYEGLDKRTSEYKTWAKFNKIGNESKGLGDTVEKVLKATGIKKIVDVFSDDCGCNERKEKLNNQFPYKRKAQRCLTEQQYKEYSQYTERRTLNVWKEEDIELLIRLYAHVFAIQYSSKDLCRSCSGSGKILFRLSKGLDIVFETYKTK